jgi:predicted pyridoxine 5'-phosphate oxidase superfamily flavin-nucleotide-binding protein
MQTLTPDMRAVIETAQLCFAATVTPDGRPSLSPKGSIRVWDDAHLSFVDVASPGTRANLAHTPWLELNVVDQVSRRGYRFAGPAALHLAGSPTYLEALQRAYGGAPPGPAPAAVVVVTVERAAALFSPAYARGDDEASLRALWRERRAALDREFEAHLARMSAARGESRA